MGSETLLHLENQDFDKEVLQSRLPTVVDFYADWCGPCRLVSPVIEALSREYAGRVKFVKVNTDEHRDVAAKYNIMSIPSIFFFKDGRVRDQVIGAGPASVYRERIDALLKN